MALNHEIFSMKILIIHELIYEAKFSFLCEAMTLYMQARTLNLALLSYH